MGIPPTREKTRRGVDLIRERERETEKDREREREEKREDDGHVATERGREFSRRHRQENSRRLTRQFEHCWDVAIVRPVCEHRVRKRRRTNDRCTHYSDVPLGLYIVR